MGVARLVSRRQEAPEDIELVFQYMYDHGWTDGLPVIPPTPERVLHMVDYLGRDPEEIIAELEPSGGVATVEKLAINAVMAGCLPEYLPVIIAAVEAMADPKFNLQGIQTTTNPAGPLVVVNGPIRHRLDINCGRNALGPGRRANATIGRAIRLILVNIGGARPGEIDKALLGMPGKYTFCLGENEEGSPWEPLHVERGFERDQSTATVVGVQGTHNVLVHAGAEEALVLAADAMATMGNNNVLVGAGNPVVFLPPGYAKLAFEQGFTIKKAVKEYLFEHSKIPADRFPAREVFPMVPLAERVIRDGKVCVAQRPEDILLVVAGGPEPSHITYSASFGHTCAVTRPIMAPGAAI